VDYSDFDGAGSMFGCCRDEVLDFALGVLLHALP
jgi:hypothetical protein